MEYVRTTQPRRKVVPSGLPQGTPLWQTTSYNFAPRYGVRTHHPTDAQSCTKWVAREGSPEAQAPMCRGRTLESYMASILGSHLVRGLRPNATQRRDSNDSTSSMRLG